MVGCGGLMKICRGSKFVFGGFGVGWKLSLRSSLVRPTEFEGGCGLVGWSKL